MEKALEIALKQDLNESTTLNEMWETLDEYYDLDHPLGKISKKLVVMAFMNNMGKLLKVTRVPERPEEDEE